MNRKYKIMGIYGGLLFFVSILLILITSFTNTKFNPSYEVENVEEEYAVSFNKNMEENVTSITEHSRLLTERNIELSKQLEEKSKMIESYEKKYNKDYLNLYQAMILFVDGNRSEAKNMLEKIDIEQLSPEDKTVYDKLLNKLQ